MYFLNLQEANDFINKSDNPKNYRLTPVTEKECAYYSYFRKIEGCEVLNIVTVDFYNIELHFCIRWNGVLMMVNLKHSFDWDEYNTFALKLVEEMDWKGISQQYTCINTKDLVKPNKINKPTAKKLDQWLEYLQAVRQAEITARDRRIAYMIGKIEKVKTLFPEASNVEWSKGDMWDSYWRFELIKGGLKYYISIRRTGEIHESLEIVSSTVDMAERMAKMSNNDYSPIVFENFSDELKYAEKQNEKIIQQYLGQQLPYIDDNQ